MFQVDLLIGWKFLKNFTGGFVSDFIGLSHSLEVFEAFFDEHSNLDSRFFLFVFYVPFIGAANAVRGKDERKKKEMAASRITAKKKKRNASRGGSWMWTTSITNQNGHMVLQNGKSFWKYPGNMIITFALIEKCSWIWRNVFVGVRPCRC